MNKTTIIWIAALLTASSCCDCKDAVVDGHNVRSGGIYPVAPITELLLRGVNEDGEECHRWTPVDLGTFTRYDVGDSIHFAKDPAP